MKRYHSIITTFLLAAFLLVSMVSAATEYNTTTKIDYIHIYEAPAISFNATPQWGEPPLNVNFVDNSTGVISAWYWNFGDGNTSASRNTTHTYVSEGIYPATLTLTGPIGNSTSAPIYIDVAYLNTTVTATPVLGPVPLDVQFTSTPTGLLPDSYYWIFGDGDTSTNQNPMHTYYTPCANYTVSHRITNGSIIYWDNSTVITTTYGTINASFSSNVTSGTYPLPVQFTDTSAVTNVTIDSWSWDFGDTGTSALQNPVHTYTTHGNFTVTFTATNSSCPMSNTTTGIINVSAPSGVTRQDIYLSPIYTLTITFRDADTSSIVPYVLVSDTLGNEQNATYGTYSQTYGYSVVTIYYSANGYVSGSRTYSMTQDRTVTIELTPTGKSTYSQSVWWTPHTVQITLMDSVYQNRLVGIPINASFNKSAIPEDWLNQMYGIQDATAEQMLNKNLYLTGVTGSDGTLTTTLLGSLQYDIHLDLSSRGGSSDYFVQAYPSDSMLNIYVPIAGLSFPGITNTNQTQRLMVSNVTEPNLSYVTMWNYYQDPTGMTSQVNMDWRFANNNTVIQWINTTDPGTGVVVGSYTMPNIRGTQIWWGINATLIDN